ncbi:hypothetical protein BJ085DRAFT_32589, partial [Dimargaris cristalligena]
MGQSPSQETPRPAASSSNNGPGRRESFRRAKDGFHHRVKNKLKPAFTSSAPKKTGRRKTRARRPTSGSGGGLTTSGGNGSPVATTKSVPASAPRTRRGSLQSIRTTGSNASGMSTPTTHRPPPPFGPKRKGGGGGQGGAGEAGVTLAHQIKQLMGPIDRYALEVNWFTVLGQHDARLTLHDFKNFLREDGLSDEFSTLLFRTLKQIPVLLDPRFLPSSRPSRENAGSRAPSRRGSVIAEPPVTPKLRSRCPSVDAFGQLDMDVPPAGDLEHYGGESVTLTEFYIAYGVYRGYMPLPGSLRSPALDRSDSIGSIVAKALAPNLAPLFAFQDEMAQFMAELEGTVTEDQQRNVSAED